MPNADLMTAYHLNARALIRLSPTEAGEDVFAFLQGLLTNDVMGELPIYAGLLSAQGKAMFDMLVWRDGADALLDCEERAADDLVKRLSLYRLRRKIAIARDKGLFVLWSPVPSPVPEALSCAIDPRLPALGNRHIAPAELAEKTESGDAAWLAHRLSHGVTEGQAELTDILWLETNAAELNGVSFTKGCYVGQENTARMNWRQKVNRRLVVVPLETSRPERTKTEYPALGLAVNHLRVEDISADLLPEWLTLIQQDSE